MTKVNDRSGLATYARAYAEDGIQLEVADGVGVIRFNRPDKHNAMSVEMWEGFGQALEEAAALPFLRVLVLVGSGNKAFVSGADISQFDKSRSTPEQRAATAARTSAWRELLPAFPRPTIACIRGYCLGGGMALAMLAHIRVASESSQFGIPAARLSIGYPFNSVRTLVSLVGPSWARMLLYSGMRIGAEEAERIGLINRRHTDEMLWQETLELARTIAGNAPLSVATARMAVDNVLRDPDERDLDAVAQMVERCANSEDFQEGRLAFLEKRAPGFTGR